MAPTPQVQTVPSLRTLLVWEFPAAIARALPKNDRATTLLIKLAVLFAGFGSERKLVTETLFWSDAPGAASICTVIVSRNSTVAGSEGNLPVTIPGGPLVQVPLN